MDTPNDASIFDKKIEDPTNRVIQGEVITPEEGTVGSSSDPTENMFNPQIETAYKLVEGKVVSVNWRNDVGDTCAARLADDGKSYNYSSMLADDTSEVRADNTMSLADCILVANVHMGLIPPHNFESIASPNQH